MLWPVSWLCRQGHPGPLRGPAGASRLGAGRLELGADLIGARVVQLTELIEYPQGLHPGLAGVVLRARLLMCVAQDVQRRGLVEAVTALLADLDSPPVARNGLLVVAQAPVDEAEGVPDGILPAAFPELPDLGQACS